ncbi:MAG: hypothetical protein JRG76_17985 [Deltaproteobacteria bacterium]|nr:hypothetical protein [Deltaproteobacteria bacterium]MBW2416391.1 hypothetical protein [Deltaproteobacteria bacterium]
MAGVVPILAILLAVATGCRGGAVSHDPPVDLVIANIEGTEISVVLELVEIRQQESEGDYTTWQLDGVVMESLKGGLTPGERIRYRRTIEAGRDALVPGSRHLASFVRRDGRLWLPDSAYHFAYTPTLERDLAARLRASD